MSKPPGPGKCVHCLRKVEMREWDHVFPESWYPDTTPTDAEKWAIPACSECNRAYGKLEKDLLIRFGLCLDPDAPESKGIVDRALRSMGIDVEREIPEKDKAHREAKKRQILRKLIPAHRVPAYTVLAGFSYAPGTRHEDQIAVEIPKEPLHKFIAKVTRGVYYLDGKRYIEPPFGVFVIAKQEDSSKMADKLLSGQTTTFERQPGLIIRRAVPSDEPRAAVMKITIWGRLEMYALVSDNTPPGHDTQPPKQS